MYMDLFLSQNAINFSSSRRQLYNERLEDW